MISIIFGILLLATFSLGQQCNQAKIINVRTWTSENSKLNIETAYIIQFKAQCQNNARNVPFYGEIDGKFLVSSADATGETYEISWSEPIKKARSGEIKVRIFDEEGYGAFRKAQRSGDFSKIKELHTVTLYHQGSYKGPSIQIEFLVTILFGVIFYFAKSSINKIQN
ncbi:Translocon-associated subunit delta [Brachionus plicatilis]|uniref:Translocon-associated protein subunit delta n=1 Tax=Brachionus plicatilis TaxID=10195 RepID=A0A3M7RHI0_BRAPC|nr:Translocon-associated subunit delta [Brachionus plicatilis]